MKMDRKTLLEMGRLSNELQDICLSAGMNHNSMQILVDKLAKKNGLRRWCDTQTPADYHALIDVVNKALRQ